MPHADNLRCEEIRVVFAWLGWAVAASPAVVHQRRPPRTTHWHGARVEHRAERLECPAASLADVPGEKPPEGGPRVENLFGVCGLELQKQLHLLILLVSALPVTVDLKAPCRQRGVQLLEECFICFERQRDIFMQVSTQQN